MKKFCLILFAAASIVTAPVHAFYIRTWLLCGPFNGTLETECIKDEGYLSPKAWDVSSGKQWKQYSSIENSVDLFEKAALGAGDAGASYAYAEIFSDRAREALLLVGSGDAVKVWLNGKNILTLSDAREFALDQDKLHITLLPGRNTLLIKLSTKRGNWKFSAALLDREESDIPGLRFIPAQENMGRIPVARIIYSSIDADDPARFSPVNLLDGDNATLWSSAHADDQWVTFDFREKSTVSRVVLNWGPAYARSYALETSMDKKNWRTIYRTDKGTGGREDIMLADPVYGGYLKLHCYERATDGGNALSEVYLFGPGQESGRAGNQRYVLIEEDKDMEARLKITAYPDVIHPNDIASITVEWDNAPPPEKYNLVIQLENKDMLPPFVQSVNATVFTRYGKRTISMQISDGLPRFDGYRFVAAFISRDKGWEDMYSVTHTVKNVKASNE